MLWCVCAHTLPRVPLQLNWLCVLFLFFPIGTETGPVIKQWCVQVKVKPKHRQIMRRKQPLPFLLLLCLGTRSYLFAYKAQKQGSSHKRCFKYSHFIEHTYTQGAEEKRGCAVGHLNVSGLKVQLTFLNLKSRDVDIGGGNKNKILFQSITWNYIDPSQERKPFQRCTVNCESLGDNRV